MAALLSPRSLTNATSSRCRRPEPRLLAASWIAAEETNLVELCGPRSWNCSVPRAIAWLDRLVAAGYELSDVESQVRAELEAKLQEPDDEEEDGGPRPIEDVELPEHDVECDEAEPEPAMAAAE